MQHTYVGIVKVYSGLLNHIQHPVQPMHIHNLAIFQAMANLKPEVYSKPCEALTRRIQNSAIVRTVGTVYSDIIQPYSGILRTLCNSYICRYFIFRCYIFTYLHVVTYLLFQMFYNQVSHIQMFYYIVQPHTPSFSVGLVKTKSAGQEKLGTHLCHVPIVHLKQN